MTRVVRANSAIRSVLGEPGIEFLEWAAGAIERILPHAEARTWSEVARRPVESVWSSQARDAIRVTIPLGLATSAAPRAVQTVVQRRSVPGSQAGGRVLDPREFDITRRIARRIAQVLSGSPTDGGAASLSAIRDAFDEQVIAEHVASHHQLDLDMTIALDAIHELAEQTYENKPLTFGGVIDPQLGGRP